MLHKTKSLFVERYIMRGAEFAELRAFAAVAHCRSFARAAESLHIAPSTLSQTVRALEERLGVTLLTRTTRRVSLTTIGARLLARFSPALEEMEAAVLEAHDGRRRPSGIVRLHALRPAYARHIEPVLGHLQQALPEVTLDLSVEDSPADMDGSAYDLVIRRADFIDTGMVARDLGADPTLAPPSIFQSLRDKAIAMSVICIAEASRTAPAIPIDQETIGAKPTKISSGIDRATYIRA